MGSFWESGFGNNPVFFSLQVDPLVWCRNQDRHRKTGSDRQVKVKDGESAVGVLIVNGLLPWDSISDMWSPTG